MAPAGLTVPLFLLFGFLVFVGLLLLCPKPLCIPAIALCKKTRTYTGRTVIITLASILLLLFASPAYDAYTQKVFTFPGNSSAANEPETRTQLTVALNVASLLLIFVLRKLGGALDSIDRMKKSECALLKQVNGLQQEYTRLSSTSNQSGLNAVAEKTDWKSRIGALQTELAEAKAQLEEAGRKRKEAEASSFALKNQAMGLENEYDRLLAENDELKRRLARSDPGFSQQQGWGGKKDA